ncbi:hydrolase [Spirochaetia bacterium]|nr:hydrolase [Spirochaetia bacterium]
MADKNLLGNYADMAYRIADSCQYPYSYLSKEWNDIPAWQKAARSKIFELLGYNPPACALKGRTLKSFEHEGLSVELVAFDQPYGPSTEGFFLKPLGAAGKLPGIVALHDHGGFKYYGKEKITAWPGEPEIMKEWKNRIYGGVSWASELAKRGYAVFAPDLFLWGSRRMLAEEVPAEFTLSLSVLEPGSVEYIKAYNLWCKEHENLIAKSLFLAGTTWPGIMAYDSMRSVDYLLSRDDVDSERIGCGGLSGGGLGTVFLAGLDSRIRCTLNVCFMSSFAQTVRTNIQSHTWMLHLPHLANYLDMPDVISLNAGSLMVQYGIGDHCWAEGGQQDSDGKLRKIYQKMGAQDYYRSAWYPGGHQFDLAMQKDGFDWFDRWLKK